MPRLKARLDRSITILIALNLVVVGVLATTLLYDLFRSSTPGHPVQAAVTAGASPSTDLMAMGLAHVPTSASCLLCHETGGEGGLKPIPAIGHPLEGWTRCAVCHTDESLGRKAPGHEGIPEGDCRTCHKRAVAGPSITQPHSRLQDQKCLDCHGSYAHLPSSMVGRNEDECWLCHKPTAQPPPEYPHPAEARLSCRTCHRSAQVGGLPIDHALRKDDSCLLCHDIRIAASPPTSSPAASPAADAPAGP